MHNGHFGPVHGSGIAGALAMMMSSETPSHSGAKEAAAAAEAAPSAADSHWAVILVHGVGDSGAGRILNAFTRNYLEHTPHARQIEPPEVRLLWTDESALPERDSPLTPLDPASYVSFRERFPMHLRRLALDKTGKGTPRHALFAEVYWADLSLSGEGMLRLLLQMFTIIFHLRFLPDRIADFDLKAPPQNNPSQSARWLRLCLYVSSWLLCGPIAGLAATEFYLIACRWAIGHIVSIGAGVLRYFGLAGSSGLLSHAGWEFSIGLSGIAGVLIALSLARFARRHDRWELWKQSIAWICLWNALVTGRALFAWAGLLRAAGPFAPDPHPIVAHIHFLLYLSRWAISLVTAVLLLAMLAWLAAWLAKRRARPALTAALGTALLQAGLWVIIVPLLLRFAFTKLSPESLASDGTLERGKSLLVLNLFAAAVVAGIVIVVWFWRRIGVRRNADRLPRLLVNAWVFRALIVLFLLHGMLFLYGTLTDRWPVHDLCATYFDPIYIVMTYIGLCISLSIGQRHVRSSLHVLMDVVSHFYSRCMKFPVPFGQPERIDISGFSVQMRIEARMRCVLKEVLRGGNVTHVTIVSHSQGTVTAVDVLWLEWTARLLAGKDVRLVTMGSPFTHVYQTYFPYRYPALFEAGLFNTRAWGTLQQTVSQWLNVFRVDDFVGTHIDGSSGFPANIPLEAGGHIRYWQAADVMDKIKGQLPG